MSGSCAGISHIDHRCSLPLFQVCDFFTEVITCVYQWVTACFIKTAYFFLKQALAKLELFFIPSQIRPHNALTVYQVCGLNKLIWQYRYFKYTIRVTILLFVWTNVQTCKPAGSTFQWSYLIYMTYYEVKIILEKGIYFNSEQKIKK